MKNIQKLALAAVLSMFMGMLSAPAFADDGPQVVTYHVDADPDAALTGHTRTLREQARREADRDLEAEKAAKTREAEAAWKAGEGAYNEAVRVFTVAIEKIKTDNKGLAKDGAFVVFKDAGLLSDQLKLAGNINDMPEWEATADAQAKLEAYLKTVTAIHDKASSFKRYKKKVHLVSWG